MTVLTDTSPVADRWDADHADRLSPAELLLYRANLLGGDRRVTNSGGGSTSATLIEPDPVTGAEIPVLWVSSADDLGAMTRDDFATLHLDRVAALKGRYRGGGNEDEMARLLPRCTFGGNARVASIDATLHAFAPAQHADHVHPNAVVAIAAAKNSRELTLEIYGDTIGWLPWRRPGFELGLMLENLARERPQAVGVVLAGHGLFTWGEDAGACYRTTVETINRAIAWFGDKMPDHPAFGGPVYAAATPAERRVLAIRLMPAIRGRIAASGGKIGHLDESPPVLEFVNSLRLRELAGLGVSFPDTVHRTRARPLVVDYNPDSPNLPATLSGLEPAIAAYRTDTAGAYARHKRADSPPMPGADPVVYLVPGLGMVTFAGDKASARLAGEDYRNTINVMRLATGVDTYVGLAEQDAIGMEYARPEEERPAPPRRPRSLAGRVALVTGGAGAIGRATAARLIGEGAVVIIADVDAEALERARADLTATAGSDALGAVPMDVTDETAVESAFEQATVDYGGLDIVVASVGTSTSAPIEDTSVEMWNRTMDALAKGCFLVAREAFRVMKRQGIGGSIVFVASRHGLAASQNAASHATAAAAEIHLARNLALEGAPDGIRVNVVNPDAVLTGAGTAAGEASEPRATGLDMKPEELAAHYRKRSLLKRNVLAEDVAEAIWFFASNLSAKSTGNIINVDAGNAVSFPR